MHTLVSRSRIWAADVMWSVCCGQVMGQPSIWGSPARESQLQNSGTELQGLLKMLLQKSSVSSHPQPNKSAAVPVSLCWFCWFIV